VLVTSVISSKFVVEGTLIQQPLNVCKFVDKKLCDIFRVRLCSICMCICDVTTAL